MILDDSLDGLFNHSHVETIEGPSPVPMMICSRYAVCTMVLVRR